MASVAGSVAQESPTSPTSSLSGDEDAGTGFSASNLPLRFLEFLQSNGIDPTVYEASQNVPRHLRIRPDPSKSKGSGMVLPSLEDVVEVEADLGHKLEPLSWLPGFYYLPSNVPIAGSSSYKAGRIFGMDAASGAAVHALQIQPGDHVLDLCAAPGAKLTMIADILGDSGSLTAVDISLPRLAATKTVLVKYRAGDRCRLFLGDATKFAWPPPVPPKEVAGFGRQASKTGRILRNVGEVSSPEELTGTALSAHEEDIASVEALDPRVHTQDQVEDSLSTGGEALEAWKQEGDALGSWSSSLLAQEVESPPLAPAGPGARRKKTRKERRRAKKLRQFFPQAQHTAEECFSKEKDSSRAVADGLQDHPELYFVGRKAWQWWDPKLDKAMPSPTAMARPDTGASELSEAKVAEDNARPGSVQLYDKVLVDAECTHDGSLKHVLKFRDWGWDTLDRRFMDPGRLEGLGALQRSLLRTGFRMLKAGGLLVYCTCSLTTAQNEDVLRDFLGTAKDACLVDIGGKESWPCKEGGVQGTIRFDPITSATGGLYVALLTKAT